MKKLLAVILATALLLATATSFATDVDLSALSYNELIELKLALDIEIFARPETKEVSVPVGVYEVGVHIPAGEYSLSQDSSYAAITLSWSDDFSDYSNIISITSVDEKGVGRIVLEDEMCVKIEYSDILFTTFAGLGF